MQRSTINIGFIVNIFIRLLLVFFLIEVMLVPDDPRFDGKAIPLRNLIVVGSLSMLFPLLWIFRGRKKDAGYPFLADNVYLSIFLVDMAGNSFNLYDGVRYFDVLAHFHGAGAFTAVMFMILRAKNFGLKKAVILAMLIGTAAHVSLEAQEYLTDIYIGTHNVNGIGDTAHDLIAGFFGGLAYIYFVHTKIKDLKKETLEKIT